MMGEHFAVITPPQLECERERESERSSNVVYVLKQACESLMPPIKLMTTWKWHPLLRTNKRCDGCGHVKWHARAHNWEYFRVKRLIGSTFKIGEKSSSTTTRKIQWTTKRSGSNLSYSQHGITMKYSYIFFYICLFINGSIIFWRLSKFVIAKLKLEEKKKHFYRWAFTF